MPDAFDPYHKWLGIPADERPPTYYRLLGVSLFEANENAIQNGADQRIAHVRSQRSGPHAAAANQVLQELDQALECLLAPAQRSVYDTKLRQELGVPRNPPSRKQVASAQRPPSRSNGDVLSPSPNVRVNLGVATNSNTASDRREPIQRKQKLGLTAHIAGVIVFGLIGLVIGWMILQAIRGSDATDATASTEQRNSRKSNATKPANPAPKKTRTKRKKVTPTRRDTNSQPSRSQPKEDLPPLAKFDETGLPEPDPENTPNEVLPEGTASDVAEELWQAAKSAIDERSLFAANVALQGYLSQSGADAHRQEAQQLLREIRAADLQQADVEKVLSQLTPTQLTALEQKRLNIDPDFKFTNPVLKQMFHDALRRHIPVVQERLEIANQQPVPQEPENPDARPNLVDEQRKRLLEQREAQRIERMRQDYQRKVQDLARTQQNLNQFMLKLRAARGGTQAKVYTNFVRTYSERRAKLIQELALLKQQINEASKQK